MIYEKIKKLAKEKGISITALERELGFSKGSLCKIDSHSPSVERIQSLATYFGVDSNWLMGRTEDKKKEPTSVGSALRIPVLGEVPCGIPLEAIELLDGDEWEELSERYIGTGQYFGLHAKGDSMSPRIQEGDVLIVRQQSDAESGDVVIAKVNGDDACCKRLIKNDDGIVLQSFNAAYDPMYFSNSDMEQIPVIILGKIIENRQKF